MHETAILAPLADGGSPASADASRSAAEPGADIAVITRAPRWRSAALLAVLSSTLLAGAALAGSKDDWDQDDGEDFHWSWSLSSGQTIEIKGVNGNITAVRAGGDKVEVRAHKHARHSDPRDVKIEVIDHEGGITVCAVYPGAGNECEPGKGGHSHTHDNDVVVDFEVRVPDRIGFVGRTVNGNVGAKDLGGPVEAHSVNGSLEISTDDVARASTVNGSIRVALGRSRWRDGLEFQTVNGEVRISFPEGLSAEIELETLNGDITCDYPIDVKGKISRRHLAGTIGDHPDGDLRVSTVNGSIRVVPRD
jgi:hypothetical protein